MAVRDEEQFWTWFSETRDQYEDSEFPAKLGRRLAALDIHRWEVGPLDAEGETMFLAFSPANKDEIDRLKEIVARAPPIGGWDVRVGKPRKFWDRVFLWSETDIEVDARSWRCVVLHYDDGLYEIVILDPVIPQSLADETETIINFVVESELGELRTLEKVCGIFAEPPSDSVSLEKSVAIEALDGLII